MIKDATITKIMTSNVITVDVVQTLHQAIDIFYKYRIRHIPVIKENKLVGILSLSDIKRLSFVKHFGDRESSVDTAIYDMLTIEQVMAGHVQTIEAGKTIREVAEVFSQKEYHALPVIDGDQLVGIVTTTDLIRHLLHHIDSKDC